eukprot:CAMPEP_0117582736 /NCGR_PEP_ID=MMETSP0784-20121206/66601_1 /TAXON_ID=39447 /ORGANISM="" /LENGTH=144 /DNA_ID=CAMNT_0005383297 /DNA_START=115 /DNA_END=549 /DNA_ORIENTATION=+
MAPAMHARTVPVLEAPDRVQRTYSVLSREAMKKLEACSSELGALSAEAEEIGRQFHDGAISAGQARTALSQVEARANKLETDGVDAIYTSELTSGKEHVKTGKREQIAELGQLFSRLEELFRYFNASEAASQSVARGVVRGGRA